MTWNWVFHVWHAVLQRGEGILPHREREEYTMYPLGPRKSFVSFFLCPQSLSIVELNSLFIILHLHTIVELLEVRGLRVWFLIVHIHSSHLAQIPTSSRWQSWVLNLYVQAGTSYLPLSPPQPITSSFPVMSVMNSKWDHSELLLFFPSVVFSSIIFIFHCGEIHITQNSPS